MDFDDIPVYRTQYGGEAAPWLREELAEGRFDFAAFTSASTVRGFAAAAGPGADFSRTLGLCIGEQTAAEARAHGIPVRVAERAAIDALVSLAVACADAGDTDRQLRAINTGY